MARIEYIDDDGYMPKKIMWQRQHMIIKLILAGFKAKQDVGEFGDKEFDEVMGAWNELCDGWQTAKLLSRLQNEKADNLSENERQAGYAVEKIKEIN